VPTLLKLDVDGGEVAVLAGAEATLRRAELRSVLVEVESELTDGVLGATPGTATLDYSDLRAGSALHVLDGSGAQAAYRQPVLVHTVDQVVESFGVAPPTLLKLDVDGGEVAVLMGAREVLGRPELRSVLVEIESALTEAVVSALAESELFLAEEVHERDGEPLPGVWYGVFERR